MSLRTTCNRRHFLKLVAAAGGALVLGIELAGCSESAPAADQPPGTLAPNAFLRIDADGAVTVIVPSAEMGQGVLTALTMLVADELEADWHRVSAELAPPDPRYAHPRSGRQVTGGSNAVRGFFLPLREAGATARTLLVEACARRLGVAAPTCRAEEHSVIHGPTGRRIPYGELVAEAAALPLPNELFLKTPDMFRYIGRPIPRLDTPAKARGSARFGQDVAMPGALVAMVERPPRFGARLIGFEAEAAAGLPGVQRVFRIDGGIAVVAEGFEAARRGRAALRARWKSSWDTLDEAAISKRLKAGLRNAKQVRRDGRPATALRGSGVIEAEYHIPYQAHACMEPLNCTAHVQRDGCDLWLGTQAPALAQERAMELTGLSREQVRVHPLFLGGGFGRRAETDFVAEAVQISRKMARPIKLMWTREDDLRHDFYRPVSLHRLRGKVDPHGRLAAWEHRIASPSILARLAPGSDGPDGTSIEGAVNLPYAIPDLRVAYGRVDLPVPVGFWRAVGNSQNSFVTECFFDELAAAGGRDPFALRREMLRDKARHRRVLELAAEKAGWGNRPGAGRARGIAVHESFHSFVAQVAEVSIEHGAVKVHRMVCAVDCGMVVNPDTVRAQMEGGIVYGLTAALKGAITVQDGAVAQSNFHDFPLLRMDEMPEIEVHIVQSGEPPTGVGEPGLPPAAPAVANALFALTGKPVRRLPIVLSA